MEEQEVEFDTGLDGAPSVVDLLKQDLQELVSEHDVLIPIEGYESSGLQVKYGMPEGGKELDNIARKVAREYKDAYSRNLYTAIDTMIHLCTGLFVLPRDIVNEPVMLDPQETGSPCRFDMYLAEIFGWDSGQMTARQVVRKLFGGNEMAIVRHAEKLSRWMQNTKANLNLEIWQLG